MLGTGTAVTMALAATNVLRNLRTRERLVEPSRERGVLAGLTVALPVRDEEANLRKLLPELLGQEARAEEILFLDDGSRDETPRILAEAAAERDFLRVISGEELPPGWRGKVFALHQLLRAARTPYVLFLDADVRLRDPFALQALWESSATRRSGEGRFGFYSVFPKPEVDTVTGLLVHQVHTHLHYFLPSFEKGRASPAAVAGCGQIMLVKKDELEAHGGFEGLAGSTHDGLGLARIYKRAGDPVSAVDGVPVFAARNYPSFGAAFRGYARNAYEGAGSPVATVFLVGALFWVFVVPFVLAPFLMANPFFAGAFFMLLYSQWRMAEAFGFGWSHVPLTPVKATASIAVHVWSLARSWMSVPTEWHGRAV